MRTSVYRPDIDGLRAVAVVSVVLFHAGLTQFGGGYVGVDVFFVISGFLITGIVLRDLTGDRFSLQDFYVRRVLRILPVLAVVVAASLVVGFFLLAPDQYADLGEAIRASASISVNHYFENLQNDYWAQNAVAENPLLHFWSLAVEEQFYIIMPITMLIVFRLAMFSGSKESKRAATAILFFLAIAAGASLVTSQWMVGTDPAASFYFLVSRAWQLLIGGLFAVWIYLGGAAPAASRRDRWLRELAALLGIAFIAAAVFLFSKQTPFPGFAALLPSIGALLLIYAATNCSPGKTPVISRFLSIRPLVFIGLISYSLYLWHWPVMVFLRSLGWYAWGMPEVPLALQLLLIAVLSAVSWRYVEQPFRHGFRRFRRPALFVSAALMLVGGWILGSRVIEVAHEGSPFAQVLPPLVELLVADMRVAPGARCEGSADEVVIRRNGGGCVVGNENTGPAKVAIIGDSHARMYTEAVEKWARREGVSALVLARSSCIPLVGLHPPTRPECALLTEATLDYVSRSRFDTVVLAGYWIDMARVIGEEELAERLLNSVRRLRAAGSAVIVLRDVPELEDDAAPQRASLESLRNGGAPVAGPSRQEHDATQLPVELAMSRIARLSGVRVIDPAGILCHEQGCLVARHGRSLYRDRHHLTDAAAVEFVTLFETLSVTAAPN